MKVWTVLMADRCKHGMNPAWCSVCRPADPPKRPAHQPPSRVVSQRRRRLVDPAPGGLGDVIRAVRTEKLRIARNETDVVRRDYSLKYVIVRTCGGRNNRTFDDLGPRTTFAHIHGHPYLWAIRKILERADNLRVLEVVPTMEDALHDSHLGLCRARNVEVRTGYDRPQLAWEGTRSPYYVNQRAFLSSLQGEQKALWDELLQMGFDLAWMTSRYFCLEGEAFLSQRLISKEFGYTAGPRTVSCAVGAVFHYLDPSFVTGENSMQRAETMHVKVDKLRRVIVSERARHQLAADLGVPYLPDGLPALRLGMYRELIVATRDGRMAKLERNNPKAALALQRRYGLDDLGEPVFRTLRVVGDEPKFGVSRERIRQLAVQGLQFLDIVPDDDMGQTP